MRIKEPLLGLLAEPSEKAGGIVDHTAGDELLSLERISPSRIVGREISLVSAESVTRYTKVRHETVDDE